MALVQGPVGLFFVRLMIGLMTGFIPMAIALVGVSTPQHQVGRALGVVQTAYPSGAIILVTAIYQAALMALEPVLVPFVGQLAGETAPSWWAGLIFSIPGLAFITMAGWWARRGEQDGYSRTLAAGLIWSAVLYFLQAVVTSSWQLGGLRLLSGVSGAAIGPGVAALLATTVPRHLRGRAFGLNQSASSAGGIVGPLADGYIASFINARGVFLMAGLLFLGGWIWVRRAVQPLVRVEEEAG